MNKNDFVNGFKKINKKNPEGISNYENNFSNKYTTDCDHNSSSDSDSASDIDDEDNFGNADYEESDTELSSVCSEHSDTEDDIVKLKSKTLSSRTVTERFRILQEESDFEEES